MSTTTYVFMGDKKNINIFLIPHENICCEMFQLKKSALSGAMYIISFAAAYDLGGVVTNSRRDGEGPTKTKRPGTLKEMHW